MPFGAGELPGCHPFVPAVLVKGLVARGRLALGIEVLGQPGLPAGAATISKNQLFCSRLIRVQFSVSRRGLRSKRLFGEPPGTRTRNRLIKRPSALAFYASRNGSPGGVLNSISVFGRAPTRLLCRPRSAEFGT